MNSVSNKYCFDTNILIGFRNAYPIEYFSDLWGRLDFLFGENRAFTHELVYDEICHAEKNKLDDIGKWMKDKSKYCRPITQKQINKVPEILSNFPKLIQPNREKEQADPWLVAMLVEMNQDSSHGLFEFNEKLHLVTDENKNSPNKLPAACRYYEISCIDRFEFFSMEDISFKIK